MKSSKAEVKMLVSELSFCKSAKQKSDFAVLFHNFDEC